MKTERFAREWARVDSLADQGLTESAEKEVLSIYSKARAADLPVHVLKAQLYLLHFTQEGNDNDTAAIRKAASLLQGAQGTDKLIWHSILAWLYRDYYNDNRYEILSRTARAGDRSADFTEWEAARFFSEITDHYLASLDPAGQKVNIQALLPVLDTGTNTRQLRPTLYDLLAFRALDFFQQEETGITQPAAYFEIDNPAYMATAAEFAKMQIRTSDSASLQWHALRVYQQLLRFHEADQGAAPLIDADIHRIAFVNSYAVYPDKVKVYRAALAALAARYPDHEAAAQASYLLLASRAEEDAAGDGAATADRVKRDLPEIKMKLDALAARFPGSEGGVNAALLSRELATRALQTVTEETLLPGRADRMLVRYRNVPHAYFRIVKVNAKEYRQQLRMQRDSFYTYLLKLAPARSLESPLPGTEDLEWHSTELKIDGLPLGAYALVSSAKPDFSVGDNALSVAMFQVTELAMVKAEGSGKKPAGYVLSRAHGAALPDVSLTFYQAKYNSRTSQTDFVAQPELKTGADGSFRPAKAGSQGYNAYSLRKGDDYYYSQDYFYINDDAAPQPAAHTHTFFFTDRSIYRPGQTIWFKGIMVRTEAEGRRNGVVAAAPTTVTLYNVNGQKITSLNLQTNEYGSFAGSFKAPGGVLTGNMIIRNESGEQSFSVEEYKRPKFKVSFDTLKGSYALNRQVTIRGTAKGYAGNNIDGATVRYKVTREARWPFWYSWRMPQPYSRSEEIAHGTLTTDAGGNFRLSFYTLPDRRIDSATFPVFTYRIHADVTDIAGETHSADEAVAAGYRSILVHASIPGQANAAAMEKLTISTTNLNGRFVPAEATVKIERLQEPGFTPRARLWPMPDQFVMDEATFRKAFPVDEYKEESKPQSWKAAAEVWKQSFTTTQDGVVRLPAGTIRRNGWYRVTVSAADKNGAQVKQRYEVQVYDPALKDDPVTPLSVFGPQEKVQPGEKVTIDILSSFGRVNLLQVITDMKDGGVIAPRSLEFRDRWVRTIQDADRGGLSLQWLTLHDNRVYTATAAINVPWDNKELNLSWETHRDKLEPGDKETWTLQVAGPRKEKVAAELLAGLYDASLDAFREHSWTLDGLWPSVGYRLSLNADRGFGQVSSTGVSSFETAAIDAYDKRYDALKLFSGDPAGVLYFASPSARGRGDAIGVAGVLRKQASSMAANVTFKSPTMMWDEAKTESRAMRVPEPAGVPEPAVAPRKNLQETAFFFPQLKTDEAGNVKFSFTMPEALTEWKFLALAHTRDLQVGQLSGSVVTQKSLMVQPSLPRFLRQGDELYLTAKISNLSAGALSGSATLELLDAQTLQPQSLPFGLQESSVAFKVEKDGSTTAAWKVRVPEARYEPVIVRMTARAGSFTDGEEQLLPVLSNRTLVTESLPLWLNGSGTRTFNFDKLLHSDSSKTLSQYRLSVEYTANPAWNAIRALPYLMEYPYECAEQTFNRYYANALAAHILDRMPKVKSIFSGWQQDDTTGLQSNLQKNQELKSALLEETPWVLDAKDEAQQRKNLALLFNSYKLGAGQDAALRKLEDLMESQGSFPWFKGGLPDRYISQYIATGIARLERLGVSGKRLAGIKDRLQSYLDRQLQNDYESLLRAKAKMEEQQIGYLQIQYLYMSSFKQKSSKALDYYRGQAIKYWPKYTPYLQGMIAQALRRTGDKAHADQILQSLRERVIRSEELGAYWKQNTRGYWWYEAPVEAQSLLIECFSEAGDRQLADELKRWLLKQKQTQSWPTTRSTADACYALLLEGSNWLEQTPEVSIRLGDKVLVPGKQEAGTGYFKEQITGAAIKPEMGKITVTVQPAVGPADKPATTPSGNGRPSYGAVYWQYFERYDRVTGAATPLSLRKQLYVARNTDRGEVLEALKAGTILTPGDKVTVRMVLQSDRDMEYLHLKDMRASCFEPLDVLSGYRYRGGLGYYESTRDASSNFFISYLPKGTYVFEYSVHVMARGRFTDGIATIQSMYAPEFGSHSEAVQVEVQ